MIVQRQCTHKDTKLIAEACIVLLRGLTIIVDTFVPILLLLRDILAQMLIASGGKSLECIVITVTIIIRLPFEPYGMVDGNPYSRVAVDDSRKVYLTPCL